MFAQLDRWTVIATSLAIVVLIGSELSPPADAQEIGNDDRVMPQPELTRGDGAAGWVDQPESQEADEPKLVVPQLSTIEVLERPELMQKIIEALRDAQTPPEGVVSGPIDELEFIPRSGSLLKDSTLDPDRDPIDGSMETPELPPHRRVLDKSDAAALAAERLLHASRLLQRLGPMDEIRTDLVNRMRSEAVRLLSE